MGASQTQTRVRRGGTQLQELTGQLSHVFAAICVHLKLTAALVGKLR